MRPGSWRVLTTAAACCVTAAIQAQTRTPSTSDLLTSPQRLTQPDIARILSASRQAIARKTYRLSTAQDDAVGRGGFMEVAMGANGRPLYVRVTMSSDGGIVGGTVGGQTAETTTHWHKDVVSVTEFTGRPARGCDSTPRAGELVVEYRNEGSGWTAAAKTQAFAGLPPALFDVMAGDLRVDSGAVQQIDGRTARAMIASWVPPAADGRSQPEVFTGDPVPNVARAAAPTGGMQSLWIDTESLLPLRWEVMYAADPARGIPAKPYHRLTFRYDPAISIGRPDGVVPPDCIR